MSWAPARVAGSRALIARPSTSAFRIHLRTFTSDSRAREAGRVDLRYDSDFDTVSRGLEARDGPPGSVWSVKRIGILTAGGDAPGLNAAIRAAVRSAIGVHGLEVVGFLNGWAGVIQGETTPLTPATVQGILHRGGTI